MKARYLPVALILSLLVGCAEDKAHREAHRAIEDYRAGDFAQAIDRLEPLSKKTNEDFVLNNCRLGSAELVTYNLDDAEAAFLRAYEVINSVGVNDGGRSLGAALVDEKIKIWKGEPFERAMANYYLGLIYYIHHDYDNARGAFENALFKLRDYTDENDEKHGYREQESDFTLATLMLAKSYQRLGRDDLARENFARVAQLHPSLRALADERMNHDSNLLLVVDFGYGPKKIKKDDGAVVGFRPYPQEAGAIPPPTVLVDGSPASDPNTAVPTIDLLAMAQDRRWQDIDTIRAIKSVAGTGLLIGGGVMGAKGLSEDGSRQRTDLAVAAGLAAAGLALKATSQADTRHWEMLPRTVFVIPMKVAPGKHDIDIQFPNVPGLHQTWHGIVVPEQGEATYYMRMQRYRSGPFDWPPVADAPDANPR